MTKTLVVILGCAFIVIGLLGFAFPGLIGTHLTSAHNLVHLATGAVALFLALTQPLKTTKLFAMIFGSVYGALGVIGLLAAPGVPSVPHEGYTGHLLVVIPHVLELGTADSVIHILVGLAFLAAGLLSGQTAPATEQMPDKEVASFKG